MNLETRAQLIPGLGEIAALARVLLDVASTGASRAFIGAAAQHPMVPGSLNYEGYCAVRKTLQELAPSVALMLTPELMLSLPRDMGGNILKQALLQRVAFQSVMERARTDIAAYSSASDGRLLESDLETFFRDVQNEIPGVRDLTESFFPFYMHAAVRALLFTLDRAGSGSVGLSALAGSPLFAQFAVLWQAEAAEGTSGDESSVETDAEELRLARWALGRGLEQCVAGSVGASNWFSVDNCVRLYRQYLSLDEDKDGMLGPSELCRFNEGAISARFVERVIAEKFTFAGQMDFRGFLDLSLALERSKEPQAVRYLFSILASSRTGRLDRAGIAFYLAEVGARLGEVTGEAVATINLVTEWLDMVGPADVDAVTVKDLLSCPLGHTALRMLTDVHALWAFDNRENLGTHKHDEDAEGGTGEV